MGFWGNGHGGVEVGDEVCLFYGGQMSFVVREVAKNEGGAEGESSGSQYVLVGECYVDGWMVTLWGWVRRESLRWFEPKKWMDVDRRFLMVLMTGGQP